MLDYCDASNPATGSKYDANANVENKNIATLIGELPKSNFIRLNRRLLTDRLKDMYGKELSDRYLELLNHHFIYKNDETNLANYCASITMYPWLNNGTIAVGGNSTAPTNLKSFVVDLSIWFYCIQYVKWCLCYSRVFDVYELFHWFGIWAGIL